ncbi:hypothetical protein ISN44_As09g003890 [Arabidopsis suecica]|uniref:Transmembrane protein n=1 Tax=Arabidopsis suecica TaxID=45249 RepID=A0A8T2ACL0_ARASU|nr:hypothetical protein ISN44_As09g003890 [Arabidopsis suecica]
MVSPSSLSGRSEAYDLKLPDQSSHIRAMMILLSALYHFLCFGLFNLLLLLWGYDDDTFEVSGPDVDVALFLGVFNFD